MTNESRRMRRAERSVDTMPTDWIGCHPNPLARKRGKVRPSRHGYRPKGEARSFRQTCCVWHEEHEPSLRLQRQADYFSNLIPRPIADYLLSLAIVSNVFRYSSTSLAPTSVKSLLFPSNMI